MRNILEWTSDYQPNVDKLHSRVKPAIWIPSPGGPSISEIHAGRATSRKTTGVECLDFAPLRSPYLPSGSNCESTGDLRSMHDIDTRCSPHHHPLATSRRAPTGFPGLGGRRGPRGGAEPSRPDRAHSSDAGRLAYAC
ncbi:hypothetical protein VTN02DRAFT_2678 [Thermoascus thermophilus]